MSDGNADVSRRSFLRTAAVGTTTAAAAAGTATAQEGNETGGGGGGGGPPDYGNWFSNVGNFSQGDTVDATGQDEVTITVGAEGNGGALAFDPPAVRVDSGATLLFEWTGEGGGHNVIGQDNPLDSGATVAEAGVHYETSLEEDGIYNYYCNPHRGQGMKGAIVVGTDYPTVDTGGGGGGSGPPPLPDSAKSLGVATSFVMAATLGLAYFFMKYGGDYDQPSVE